MPKETFFNLAAEKREHITNVAIGEFANNEYGDVSISRFVAKAGIAKGSFYQYFEDKEDLFGYLLDLIIEKKTEMLSLDHPDPQRTGVFHYLHWLVRTGVEFTMAYPELTRMGYRALRTDGYPSSFSKRANEEGLAFYKRLVQQGVTQGDIRADIDTDLAAFVFFAVFSNLGQYLMERFVEQAAGWQQYESLFEQPEVVEIFDQTVNILECGLGRASSNLNIPQKRNIQEVSA